MIEEEDKYNDDFFDEQYITADPKLKPVRLDKYVMDKSAKVSRNKVQNAIRAGAITVNGQAVKPNFKVKPGHVIRLIMPKAHNLEGGVIPENIPLDIIYEDDDLMVINKPVGLVVHPGVGNRSGTLVNALAYYFKDKDLPVMEGNSEDRVGLVHRIDKNTSGLMVIAKTDYAITHLAAQFFKHTIYRRYTALVWSEPNADEGIVTANVGRHPKNRIRQAVFPEGDLGKHAVTHWKVLERLYYVSLLECRLETGRTHQIRVHMEHLGHPLFNDEKYSGDRINKGTVYSKYKAFVQNCFDKIPRHALHAHAIGFQHPTTGEEMRFESKLPDDFQNVLVAWRGYVADRKAKKVLE